MIPVSSIARRTTSRRAEGTARRGERVVDGRRLREPGEERGLGERQPAGRLREVRLRGGLDAVGLVPVVHLVQVRRQDPVLRPGAVELRREAGLLELALHGPLPRDVEVPDELLGDRRASLDDAARLEVGHGRAGDSFEIDASVREEAPVLDRDRRLPDPDRHLVGLDRLAVALGRDRPEQRSVGRVDERVLPDPDLPQRVEVARGAVGEDCGSSAHAGDRADRGENREPDDDATAAPALSQRALAAAARHVQLGVERRTPAGGRAHEPMLAAIREDFDGGEAAPQWLAACVVME